MAVATISGLPALTLMAGFVAAATVPVWMGAQVVGAQSATILRSALALGLAVLGSFLAMFVVGSAVLSWRRLSAWWCSNTFWTVRSWGRSF